MVIEKIEIEKNTGNYTYTGELTDLKDDWVKIVTSKEFGNETLYFRKEQIMQRRIL